MESRWEGGGGEEEKWQAREERGREGKKEEKNEKKEKGKEGKEEEEHSTKWGTETESREARAM